MANSVNTQIIQDGPRNVVVKIEGILDTSDLASTVAVDPAALAGMDNTGSIKALGLIVDRVQFSVEDLLEVRLAWDATTPQRMIELTGRGTEKFERFGGLTNNSGAGRTGKILISTQGWVAAAVLSFTVILTLKKQGTL
jgi:hypothetical protein